MIGYWIQKHDYSSETVNESNLTQTLKAFKNFDWDFELSQFQEEIEGKNSPPGIGINNGKRLDKDGSFLLHICPFNEQSAYFNFHYRKPSSFLGISTGTSAEVHHVAEYSRNKISELIELFYSEEYEQLIKTE